MTGREIGMWFFGFFTGAAFVLVLSILVTIVKAHVRFV